MSLSCDGGPGFACPEKLKDVSVIVPSDFWAYEAGVVDQS